jgi:Fe-S cluster assembly ATP-binding protein
MLKISNLHAKLADENKQILNGVDLVVNPGEVHVIQGANGSGKSTLSAVLTGHPGFIITEGEIKIAGEDYPEHIRPKIGADTSELLVNDLAADQRALAGIFLANQYPMEIPGVNLSNFLRLAYNARQEKDVPVFKFRKLLKECAEIINYPEHLLDRNLNEGFSGGEKKKTEILQLAVLEPRYAILDETDSGLDKQAISDVFNGINKIRELHPHMSFIVITHYEKVFDYIKPQFVHIMEAGKLIDSKLTFTS